MKLTVTDESRFNSLQAAFQDRETFTLTGAGVTTDFLATEFSYSPNHAGIGSQCVELELVQVSKAAAPAWKGEGLPPVGLEVEGRVAVGHYVGAGKSEWAPCALVCASRAYVVLRCIGAGYSADHEVSHERALVEFRPIRTAEQIAAEERKAREAELAIVIKASGWESPEILAAYLESHGYRKVGQ